MKANSKTEIPDVVDEVRVQTDEGKLFESFRNSPEGLRSVLEKLLDQQRNAMTDMVDDIRSAMTESVLMAKYGLSPAGLKRTLETILELELIDPEELDSSSISCEDTARAFVERQRRRTYPVLTASIHPDGDPDNRGLVRDISDKGVCAVGLETEVDVTETFTVVEHEFPLFRFEAKCRWARKPTANDEAVAGLEITRISEADLQELSEWVSVSTMGFEEEDDPDLFG
jgi:hypothetical protein